MIERIPQRLLLPSIGSFRSNILSQHSLFAQPSLRSSAVHPKQHQFHSKRFYATPTPDFSRQKPPSPSESGGLFNAPKQSSQYETISTPSFLSQPGPNASSSPPRPKRSLRPYIYATIFFIIGISAGKYVSLVITPPPLPSPGTPADTALTGTIHTMASKLPLVQQLSSDPSWTSWDAYSIFSPSEKPHRMTSGALGGSRGLGGYQRIFHNKSTGEFISVLWIGGALAGWPGVAHGGLLAIVLDESMGRAAVARFAVRTGVTAKLELSYKAPTLTNAFYVIRAIPIEEESTDRKGWVKGTVEEMGGKVCVEAKGLFVVPKGAGDVILKPVEKHRLEEGF